MSRSGSIVVVVVLYVECFSLCLQNNIRCSPPYRTVSMLFPQHHYNTSPRHSTIALHHTTTHNNTHYTRNPAICRNCPSHRVPFTGYVRSSAQGPAQDRPRPLPKPTPMWTRIERIERIDRIDILWSCSTRYNNASLLMTVVPRCSVPPQLVLSGALPRAATTYISLRG